MSSRNLERGWSWTKLGWGAYLLLAMELQIPSNVR